MDSNSNITNIVMSDFAHTQKKAASHQFLNKMKVFNTNLIIIAHEGISTAKIITILHRTTIEDST